MEEAENPKKMRNLLMDLEVKANHLQKILKKNLELNRLMHMDQEPYRRIVKHGTTRSVMTSNALTGRKKVIVSRILST